MTIRDFLEFGSTILILVLGFWLIYYYNINTSLQNFSDHLLDQKRCYHSRNRKLLDAIEKAEKLLRDVKNEILE